METKTDLQLKGTALVLIVAGLAGQLTVDNSKNDNILGMDRKMRGKIYFGAALLGGVIMGYTIIKRKK